MSFKASKKRERRAPKPVGEGTQLIASAAVRDWYALQMRKITNSMIADYKKELNRVFEIKPIDNFYAQDASPESIFTTLLNKLNRKWKNLFEEYSRMTALQFVDRVDVHSKSTCWFSMTTAGIKEPKLSYNENVANTLGASIKFNETLITGIQQDVHEKIYNAVMLSMTSPNPEEQGTSGIESALREVGTFSKKRIDLIARDQNSKIYSSLNTDRMKENGVEKFKWIHSSAGKVPRPSHLAKNEQIFLIDDPKLWEGPKADQGPPGWAINCRCRAVPVID